MDAAFAAWLPLRHAVTHRTHGEVIAVRVDATGPPFHRCPSAHTWSASDTSAGLARTPWSSAASHHSVPWRKVRARQPGGAAPCPEPGQLELIGSLSSKHGDLDFLGLVRNEEVGGRRGTMVPQRPKAVRAAEPQGSG